LLLCRKKDGIVLFKKDGIVLFHVLAVHRILSAACPCGVPREMPQPSQRGARPSRGFILTVSAAARRPTHVRGSLALLFQAAGEKPRLADASRCQYKWRR
jgi:hypothetical protein